MSVVNCNTCRCNDTYVRMSRRQTRFTGPQLGLRSPLFASTSSYELLNAQCLITGLPVEILHSILNKAVADESWLRGIYKISFVCRIFHRYSQQRLFNDISLAKSNVSYDDEEHSLVPACTRVRDLYSLIVADPVLGQMCKSLIIKLPLKRITRDVPENLELADYTLAIDLFQSLPNIRSLEICNGFGQRFTLAFLKVALHGRTCLESVKFACGQLNKERAKESLLALIDVWECIQGLTLNQLCIRGVRPRRDGCIWEISEEAVGSVSLSNIELENYGGTLETLVTLIGLLPPSTLRHFSFNVSTKTQKSKLWSLQNIQSLLDGQRDSLRSIAIGAITANDSPSNFAALSFQDFRELETLRMSRWDMENVTAEAACTALLAPKLREFIWDFTDLERQSWDAFGKKERDWILEFAQCAINRRAKLKTIKIIFSPPTYWAEESSGNQLVRFWPWDLMDQVKDAVGAYIDVVYNDHISKRECKKLADSFMRLVYGQDPATDWANYFVDVVNQTLQLSTRAP